jgi:membrane-bound lytic murein transglycosylase B
VNGQSTVRRQLRQLISEDVRTNFPAGALFVLLAIRARSACVIVFSLFATSLALAQDGFEQCVSRLERDAIERGISAATVQRILPNVSPLERVIRADRSQPEFVQTFGRYVSSRVTDQRVAAGRALYTEYREFLSELTDSTGVPGQYLVAFWGLESNFGGVLGNVPVFNSLATLACDQRRGAYFTTELINAMRIVDQGQVAPERMIGSWAGAMGQTQFMPSVYLDHATDGDRDGVADVWSSAPDALASAASYLASLDWRSEFRWGREVLLPDDFDFALAGRDRPQALTAWRALGIRDVAGNPVAALEISGRVIVPAGSAGPAFLVYDNFDAIMRWNRSEFFAISVGHLADRIAGSGPLSRMPPNGNILSREKLQALQASLESAGYDPGPADGILGSGTRTAIRSFQQDNALVADGYPSAALFARFGIE